jgi:hypothetical protein
MSKIKIFFGFLIALSISACTDWVDPAIPYNEFDTGAYLRTLSSTANFNFFALSTSKFSVMVEAVDAQDGKTVKEVDVLVRRRRGQALTPEVKVVTVPASAFQPHSVVDPLVHPASGSKYPAATIEVTVTAALQAMNLTLADITGGDFFEFRLILYTTDGRTFTNTNLSPDLSGGQYYRSPFFYRIPVVCPSTLGGTYDLSTTGWCGTQFTGQVKFIPGTTTGTYIIQVNTDGTNFVEDFSFGFYRACYGANTAPPGGGNGLRLTDACGQIAYNSSQSSPWGDNFFVDEVTVNGPTLTLAVRSSYPPEAGTAVITRTDGTNWPPLRK